MTREIEIEIEGLYQMCKEYAHESNDVHVELRHTRNGRTWHLSAKLGAEYATGESADCNAAITEYKANVTALRLAQRREREVLQCMA
jgi:hypothetical protein